VYGKTGKHVSGAYINNNPKVRGITLDLDDYHRLDHFQNGIQIYKKMTILYERLMC